MTNAANVIFDIRAVADYVRTIDPDDGQLLADMIEAETDADALLDMLIERDATCQDHVAAIAEREKALRERKSRFKASLETGRTAMLKVLEAAQARKIERPEATVSISRVAPKVIGDDVLALPAEYHRATVTADRSAVKDALLGGATIPGWHMSNGSETVTVRRR